MDFFTDFFNLTQLLESVNKSPYVPGRLGELGLFTTKGLNSTQLAIEEQPLNAPSILASTPRGTPSGAQTFEKRAVHTFETSHYRKDGSVMADEVLGIRAAGMAGQLETIQARRDEVIAQLRRDIDITLEYLRMDCLNSPSNALGTAPAPAAIAFGTSDSAIEKEVFNKIIQPLEAALGGIPFTGITAICHDDFWEALLSSKTRRETFLNQQAANSLRGSVEMRFSYLGIMWERYRGSGSVVIDSATAKIVPMGIPNLFIQAFAPADTLDSVGVGAMGVPYYPQAYPIDNGNRGWYIEMQTNPVMVCTRPDAILTIDLS